MGASPTTALRNPVPPLAVPAKQVPAKGGTKYDKTVMKLPLALCRTPQYLSEVKPHHHLPALPANQQESTMETKMTDLMTEAGKAANLPTAPATPSKMELLQAKRAEARAAKAAAKAAKKEQLAAKRADGVIGTIKQHLELANGTTRREVLDHLVAKFPERDRDGMAVTVGIQFSRLQKSTGRKITSVKELPGRVGRVYGFVDTLVLPEVVAEAPAPTTPADTPAPVAELHTEAAHKPAKVAKSNGSKRVKQAHNR